MPAALEIPTSLHRQRPIRFVEHHRSGSWSLKVYGISADAPRPPTALLDRAVALAEKLLPPVDRPAGPSGFGWVTAHQARDYAFVLVGWFAGENEIHQRVLSSSLDAPERLADHPSAAIGCVWEMEVTDFERRAWLRHVLDNPSGPDVAAYEGAHLDADV